MHPETLTEWARRQGATGVSATGPRPQLNRVSLNRAAAAKSREMALKELYIELEQLVDIGATVRASSAPSAVRHTTGITRTPHLLSPALAPALQAPTLGGRVFFPTAAPAANSPSSAVPAPAAGFVERRRPRP